MPSAANQRRARRNSTGSVAARAGRALPARGDLPSQAVIAARGLEDDDDPTDADDVTDDSEGNRETRDPDSAMPHELVGQAQVREPLPPEETEVEPPRGAAGSEDTQVDAAPAAEPAALTAKQRKEQALAARAQQQQATLTMTEGAFVVSVEIVSSDDGTSKRRRGEARVLLLAAVVRDSTGKECGAMRLLCTPEHVGIEASARLALTRECVTEDTLRQKQSLEQQLPDFFNWVERRVGASGSAILVTQTERQFAVLEQAVARAGQQWPAFLTKRATAETAFKYKTDMYKAVTELASGGAPSFSLDICLDVIARRGGGGSGNSAQRSSSRGRAKQPRVDPLPTMCGGPLSTCLPRARGSAIVVADGELWGNKQRRVGMLRDLKQPVAQPHRGAGAAPSGAGAGHAQPGARPERAQPTSAELPRGWTEVDECPPAAPTENGGVDDAEAEIERQRPAFRAGRGPNAPGPTRAMMLFLITTMGLIAHETDPQKVSDDNDPEDVLLACFLFFFTPEILQHIANCTNARAKQWMVKDTGPDGRMRWRLLSREDPERLRFEAKQRVTNWVDATPWEMLVIIGLMLRMGVSPLAQLGYYWTQDHLVPDIAEAMTQKRFLCLLAQLSFMDPLSSEFEGDPLRKIRWLNDALLGRAAAAWNWFQHLTLDEQMIRCLSKRASKLLVYIPRKPVRWGIKNILLADERHFPCAWEIFVPGSGGEDGYVLQLIQKMFTLNTWNRGFVLFADSWFVTVAVAVWLAQRGTWIVGPTKSKRPASPAAGDRITWPFWEFLSGVSECIARGWRRTASCAIAGCRALLYATVWRDTKMFTLLYTAYQSKAPVSVRRWDKQEGKYRYFSSFIAQRVYARRMGVIDRIDREQSGMHVRQNRVGERWQRSIFWHLVGLMALAAKAVFECVCARHKELGRDGVHYSTRWQTTLGRKTTAHGTHRHMEATGEDIPHFMPKLPGRKPRAPVVSARPRRCQLVQAASVRREPGSEKFLSQLSDCVQCFKHADITGDSSMRKGRSKPASHPTDPGGSIRQTRRACAGCRVHLCPECYEKYYDHNKCRARPLQEVTFTTVCGRTQRLSL